MGGGRRFAERSWGRWGLLLSAVVLGIALMIASWSNFRSARQAVQALHVGQARVFERALIGALRHGELETATAFQIAADSLLADYRSEGLRYVAVLGPDDTLAAAAGQPAGTLKTETVPDGRETWYRMTEVDSRVRVSLLRPRLSGAGREAAPHRDHRPAGIIFEFEPLIAMRLMERARGLLLFGMAGAAVMLAVAVLSWSMSRRYERAMRKLEDQRRLSLLGEMSAVLAHEIRNPLASLKGHAQLLAEKLPPASAELRKAEIVVREAVRLEALTSDLLDFVRIGPLNRVPVDPVALVRSTIREVDPEGFLLQTAGAPERWPLAAQRLRQALINLLRNARQATPADAPPPVVSVSAAEGKLVIEVRDFGPGLPAGQADRIFDPFFTTRTAGTGLGLAVARRIVEHHGGTLAAANHADGGAVFRIEVPAGEG